MLQWFETFLGCAEIVGTVAFAASGAILAIQRDLDLFGVVFIGTIAAVGGGIVRDLLLNITPPSAFQHPIYVLVAAMTALAVFLFVWLRRRQSSQPHPLLDALINLLDAVGLGAFSVVGAETAALLGHSGNLFLCVFMGTISGIGGGILRDLLSLQLPAVLYKRVYAVASIAGSLTYCLLEGRFPNQPLCMALGIGVTVVIRVCASHFRWDLPVARKQDSNHRHHS